MKKFVMMAAVVGVMSLSLMGCNSTEPTGDAVEETTVAENVEDATEETTEESLEEGTSEEETEADADAAVEDATEADTVAAN